VLKVIRSVRVGLLERVAELFVGRALDEQRNDSMSVRRTLRLHRVPQFPPHPLRLNRGRAEHSDDMIGLIDESLDRVGEFVTRSGIRPVNKHLPMTVVETALESLNELKVIRRMRQENGAK